MRRDLATAVTLAAGGLPLLLGQGVADAAPGDQLEDSRIESFAFTNDGGQQWSCSFRVVSVLTEQPDGSYSARTSTGTVDIGLCAGAMSMEVTYTDVDGDERRAATFIAPGAGESRLEVDDVGSSYVAKHVVRFTHCDPAANATCSAVRFTNPFNPK